MVAKGGNFITATGRAGVQNSFKIDLRGGAEATGDVYSDGNVYVALTRHASNWTGRAINLGSYYNAYANWTMTGDSFVNNFSNGNQSHVVFAPPVAGQFKSLTLGSVWNLGKITMNTQLGGDGSPSDLIIIRNGMFPNQE